MKPDHARSSIRVSPRTPSAITVSPRTPSAITVSPRTPSDIRVSSRIPSDNNCIEYARELGEDLQRLVNQGSSATVFQKHIQPLLRDRWHLSDNEIDDLWTALLKRDLAIRGARTVHGGGSRVPGDIGAFVCGWLKAIETWGPAPPRFADFRSMVNDPLWQLRRNGYRRSIEALLALNESEISRKKPEAQV